MESHGKKMTKKFQMLMPCAMLNVKLKNSAKVLYFLLERIPKKLHVLIGLKSCFYNLMGTQN